MQHKRINTNLIVEGYSPRRDFSRKKKLKESIEKEGLLEPLSVRQNGEDYVIIDGNLRFRAVRELGFQEVDCIVIDADEEKSYHLAYVKNTERKNLNPIEVALHLQTIKDKFGYNNEELVRQGYAPHRSSIDDKLSLLTLPEDIQEKISGGTEIGPSHGYELAKLPDDESQKDLFNKIIKDGGMSVRKLKSEIRSRNVRRKREEEENLPQVEIPQGDLPGVFFKDSCDMSEIANESVGLGVTSPPYNLNFEYERGVSFDDHLEMLDKVFSECTRVFVPGGKFCVNFGDIHNFGTRNGGKPEIKLMGHHYQEILGRHGMRLIDKIIWKKCTPGKRDFNWSANPQSNYHEKTKHASYRIIKNTEHIYIFEKDGKREVPFDIEVASRISKKEYDKWNDEVWEIPPVKGKKGHPAPFPEELVKRLILLYSYKGDLVLDCFGGSMTTVKVANELGRIGIGYEKEEKYKPVIMEKLGLTKEDLKKPEVDNDRGTKGGTTDFINQFEGIITEILAENNKTTKDVVSVRVPLNSGLSKDEIEIDWVKDDEEPDPSGPTASPQLFKADDYEKANVLREVA